MSDLSPGANARILPGIIGPYQRLYPSSEVLTFDGGIDTKFEKALLPDNESPDCLNVEFINGSVTTRQGAVRLNTISAFSAVFDGLYTRRGNDASETMIAFIGGHMMALGTTTFITIASAQSVFTAGQRVGCDTAENYLFIGNGGAGPYKWDGTYFTLHGVVAPTATAVVGSGTTGSLTTNGQYVYKYTYVNTALVEGNLSPATATFVVSTAGLAINLSNIAVGSSPSQGIAFRYLYRTDATGTGIFSRVTKINDNVTTSFVDTVADTSRTSPAPTDNGVPPFYNAIIYHSNILFVNDVNNPNYVWYSNIGTPYTFASTNFFKVGDKTSDLVKGFAHYDNYIVIFCEQSTWINFMPDPTTPSGWRQVRVNSPYGSKSPYCPINVNVKGQDYILHAAAQNRVFSGFALLSGTTLDPSVSFQAVTTAGSDLQSQVIEPDMFLVQTAYQANISGIAYKNRAFISMTYGANNTANNRVYVWDYSLSNLSKNQIASWVPWTGTAMNIQQFAIYGGKLYGCSSGNSGFVYQIGDTGVYNDDGAAINSYWWSKEYYGYAEDQEMTKDFRYINLLYDLAGNYYMNLRYLTDSDSGSGSSQQISLNGGGSQWGTMVWGRDNWGGGNTRNQGRIYFGSIQGKTVQFRFDNQNTVNQRFKVYRGQISYTIRGYR